MSNLKLRTMVGFVVSTQPGVARHFYEHVLGFAFLTDDPFALAFNANDSLLRVLKAKTFSPAAGTVLGWEVADISAFVRELNQRGVTFERFPGMPQDDLGVCTFPGGDKVAWFKDPEGNVLSLSQHVVSVA